MLVGIPLTAPMVSARFLNEDENGDIDVYDAADGTSGEQVFSSSFSNSSNSVLINEANDRERLKEKEERKEPSTEDQPLHSNASVVGVADKEKGETPIYSKDSSISSAPLGTGSVGEAGSSAARPRRREVKAGEYEQSEYYRLCLNNYVLDLADMRKGILPNDGKLFWQAVKLYESLRGCSEQQAVSVISSKVSEIAQRDN